MTRFRAPVRVVMTAIAVITACFAHTGATPRVLAQTEGVCADNEGITVVVDFQELGGGVNTRCASGSLDNALEALARADIAWEGTLRFPGFVCRIAGLPTPDDEPCANTPPATAYWSYWIAERGGEWCYANVGPTGRTPPPGSIEGWSFALDKAEADIPPPRLAVPAAVAGTTPNPVRSSDCTTPEASGSTTTTTTTTTTTSTTSSTTSIPVVANPTTTAPASPSTSQSVTPSAVDVDAAVDATDATDATDDNDDSASNAVVTTSVAPATSTTLLATDAPIDAAPVELVEAGSEDVSAAGRESQSSQSETLDSGVGSGRASGDVTGVDDEVGTVDLSDDRRDGGGFGVSTVLAFAAIFGVAIAGIVATRRRSRALQVEM